MISTLPRSRIPSLLALVMVLLSGVGVQAKIQFDVFPGFDSVARAGGWYPVVVEVFNDGAGFNGVVEISQTGFNSTPSRYAVELPQGTRKRLILPAFSTSQGFTALDARLYDDGGSKRAESLGLRVNQAGWENFILGAAPQSFSGMPAFPEIQGRAADFQPRVARLSIGQGMETFPDNPLVLSSLNAIYLNSSRALDLKEPQVEALMAWVHGGGHVIVAVDQPTDVNATAWLKDLLPASVEGVSTRALGADVNRWLRGSVEPGTGTLQFGAQPPPQPVGGRGSFEPYAGRESDPAFEQSSASVVTLRRRSGVVLAGSAESPLILSAPRGRGLVTVLAFSPERDPLKAWKNRPWFWAKLAGVPKDLLGKSDFNAWGGRGVDGVVGAMIETRQVQKLPVGVLLLLLLVYLAVIGPLDQWWLKKINRPMLTWITFPSYVVLFSLLIYYIGFRLRAGNSEWNELHVVDVYQRSGDAVMRGYSYGSVYSPANNTYRMALEADAAIFRPEFQGFFGAGMSGGRIRVSNKPRGFDAEVEVPVWTSQLVASEWWQSGVAPVQARIEGKELVIANRRSGVLTNVVVIRDRKLIRVGAVEAGSEKRVDLSRDSGEAYMQLASGWSGTFTQVSSRRSEVFGGGGGVEHIDNWAEAATALSFTEHAGATGGQGSREFIWPAGFDLTPVADRGDTIVIGYLPDDSLVPALNKFSALRQSKATLVRLVLTTSR